MNCQLFLGKYNGPKNFGAFRLYKKRGNSKNDAFFSLHFFIAKVVGLIKSSPDGETKKPTNLLFKSALLHTDSSPLPLLTFFLTRTAVWQNSFLHNWLFFLPSTFLFRAPSTTLPVMSADVRIEITFPSPSTSGFFPYICPDPSRKWSKKYRLFLKGRSGGGGGKKFCWSLKWPN